MKNEVFKIDFRHVASRFQSCLSTYNSHAEVQRKMAEYLANKINMYKPENFTNILEIGSGTGMLTRKLLENPQLKNSGIQYLATDLVDCKQSLQDLLHLENFFFQKINMYELIENNTKKFELIVANAVFQWSEDLYSFLLKIKTNLTKQGSLLAFTHFGPSNLQEIRTIEGVGLNYYSKDFYTDLSRNLGFELLIFSEEQICLKFSSPEDVLKHMRFTGVTGIEKKVWSRAHLQNFKTRYQELFCHNNEYRLTYHPQYIIMKAL